jgi:predicted hotdog family 3-hydroxylacyl-ACP dehydratase
MPATILLEHMAQAIAAANGMADRVAGRASSEMGLLLGTRELELFCDELAVGEVLELRVVREFSDGKLARYACTAARADELLARATINVMVMPVEELRT